MPKLDNWMIVPSYQGFQLHGDCSGHERMELNGKTVYTSLVRGLDVEGRKAKTLNTDYDLGEPQKAWIASLEKQGIKLDSYNKALIHGDK